MKPHLPRSPERAAYEAESLGRTRRGAVAYCVIGGVLVVVTAAIDPIRFPQGAGTLVRVRGIGLVALMLVLALLQSPWGRRHPRLAALLAPSTAGALLHTLVFFTGGDASPVNLSAFFAIVGVGFLIPWPVGWSLVACAIMVGGYLVRALAVQGTALGAPFVEEFLPYATGSAIAIVATALRERQRWRDFGRRRSVEEAHRLTRESEQRYRSLVETAGSMILTLAPDGRITELNREAERVLGWSREEAIGREYLALGVPELSAVPGGAPPACSEGPTRGLEARIRARDGSERTLVCNASPLVDEQGRMLALIVCAQDITDRKRVEEALRESETRLRTVIANAPVVLFMLDRGGIITLTDGNGLRRIGLSPGEVVGQHYSTALRGVGGDVESFAEYFGRALAGEAMTWIGSTRTATFECRLAPLHDTAGHLNGVIGLAIDVSERQQAEEARLALERQLLEGQKLESLGVMAAGIAHDFNNLLATVLGNASLALSELPPDAALWHRLKQIEVAARRGSELTRQMLAYAGHEAIAPEVVDVNALIGEMAELVEVSVARGVTSAYELADDLPSIEADPTQIRQVLVNLVINASESMGERGGHISVRTGLVDLDEATLGDASRGPDWSPGPHVCLEVADTGCGIEPGVIEKIFDPFFSTKFAGRGLGLATLLGIVRSHRGALAVSSEPGRGTTFRVFLPCTTVPAAADTAAPRARTGSRPRTVLLVDDADDVRAVTQHMLEHLGCSVLVAGDGREGVEVFRAHAETIDAVIVDLTLPRLSGDSAFSEMRRIRPDARVILMSGYTEESATRGLNEAGLAGFLRKPFSVAELRTTMARALGA